MAAVPTHLTDVDDLPAGARPLRAGDRVHLPSRSGTAETEAWDGHGVANNRSGGTVPDAPTRRSASPPCGRHCEPTEGS